jgi:hypothetical protein
MCFGIPPLGIALHGSLKVFLLQSEKEQMKKYSNKGQGSCIVEQYSEVGGETA